MIVPYIGWIPMSNDLCIVYVLRPSMFCLDSYFFVVVPCHPTGTTVAGQIGQPRLAETEKQEEAKI